MSKIISIPSSLEMIYKLVDKVDGYIIGIDNLSVNLPVYFNIEETIEIINFLNKNNKEIFISLNKNMHNNDIPFLTEILKELDLHNITGIMYYDISIVNLKEKLNLKNDLVWSQEHLTTNSSTTNYWYQHGSKYTYLSSEITLNEIKQIKENTTSKLLVNIFGYVPIFTSYRHLVDNYIKTFNLTKINDLYYLSKEGFKYPIIDDKLGTTVYSGNVLNGIKDYLDLHIDYVVLNSFLINDYEKVLDLFKCVNKENIDKIVTKINEIVPNNDTGFLHQETIYKVK